MRYLLWLLRVTNLILATRASAEVHRRTVNSTFSIDSVKQDVLVLSKTVKRLVVGVQSGYSFSTRCYCIRLFGALVE